MIFLFSLELSISGESKAMPAQSGLAVGSQPLTLCFSSTQLCFNCRILHCSPLITEDLYKSVC